MPGRSVKYNPMDGCTNSGFPVGCMCTLSTMSVEGSTRHAMPSGSTQGIPPGFQNRKWLSGSKVSASIFRSMPPKPAPRRLLLHTRGAAAVDENVGMMHGAGIAGTDLDGLHPTRACQLYGQHKIPVIVGAVRAQMIGSGCLDHQVGRAKLPSGNEFRHGRSIGGRTCLRALPYPFLDGPNLVVGEPPLVLEIAVARFRQPGRHVAPLGHGHNLRAALLYIVVSEQGERGGFARTMARRRTSGTRWARCAYRT